MEEADGRVYCTFQNVSTARLVGAVASRGQPGPQDRGREPWWLTAGRQAQLSKRSPPSRRVGVEFTEEKGKGGNRLGMVPEFLPSSSMAGRSVRPGFKA